MQPAIGAATADIAAREAVRSSTITIPSAVFTPMAHNTPYVKTQGAGGAFINGAAASPGLVAPLSLPHGARITEVQYRYLDNNGAENLSFSILGENVAAILLASGVAGASTSGSDAAYRVATVQPGHVISPDFGYAVSAFSAGWPSVKLLLQVKSVQITYELPT